MTTFSSNLAPLRGGSASGSESECPRPPGLAPTSVLWGPLHAIAAGARGHPPRPLSAPALRKRTDPARPAPFS